jgi:hypothetical protein
MAPDSQHVVLVTLDAHAPCCGRVVRLRVQGVVGADGETSIDGAAAHALALHVRYCSG